MKRLIKSLFKRTLPIVLAGTIAACGGRAKSSTFPSSIRTPTPIVYETPSPTTVNIQIATLTPTPTNTPLPTPIPTRTLTPIPPSPTPSPTSTLTPEPPTPTPTRFECVQPNVDFRNDTGVYILFGFTGNAAKEIGVDVNVNDVSPCNNIYYAFDFRWEYGGYGTMGLQQFEDLRQVNFSVFDVGIVGYNADGSECVYDSEGAISCRTPFNWKEGVRYQYRVIYGGEDDGDNWWRTEVVDLDSGERIDTGRILIPSDLGLLRFDTSIWVEEVYPSRCKNEPTTVVYSNTSFKTDVGYSSLERANLIYNDIECPESDVDYVDGNFVIEYGSHVIRDTEEGDLLR